jgi:hypothetical protein
MRVDPSDAAAWRVFGDGFRPERDEVPRGCDAGRPAGIAVRDLDVLIRRPRRSAAPCRQSKRDGLSRPRVARGATPAPAAHPAARLGRLHAVGRGVSRLRAHARRRGPARRTDEPAPRPRYRRVADLGRHEQVRAYESVLVGTCRPPSLGSRRSGCAARAFSRGVGPGRRRSSPGSRSRTTWRDGRCRGRSPHGPRVSRGARGELTDVRPRRSVATSSSANAGRRLKPGGVRGGRWPGLRSARPGRTIATL